MSIPLPQSDSTKAWEIFLDHDERWDVYQVKAKERPHLLTEMTSSGNEVCDHDEDDSLPLTDGCDIPGWRRDCVMEVSPDLRGVLNIGASSFYFRKARQWPRMNASSICWNQMMSNLSRPPVPLPPMITCEVASEQIDWKNGKKITKFALEWEKSNRPVVIENCTKSWKAMPKIRDGHGKNNQGWTFDQLLQRFGDISWRFSDNHGETMSLSTYSKYIRSIEGLTDDSPLAIYDAEFGDDEVTKMLLDEYSVPPCFSQDLFELADVSGKRPPYRWILIGPARSGTGLHIDPLWTNAWVTVLQGSKRWMLFPKETPPTEIGIQEPQIPSVIWFRDYYDKVTSKDWPSEWKPVEVLQKPGETVFVPNGWPHLVLNLELTVAVTHNYASEFGPFKRMWEEVMKEEKEFAKAWVAGLKTHRRDLWEIGESYL